MRLDKSILRWLAVLAAVVLLSAACGDDGGTTSEPDADPPASDSSDDSTTDPEPEADPETDPDPDPETDPEPEPEPDPVVPSGSFDCAELSQAMERAQDIAGDPTAGGSGDPAQEFEQSRAALAALGSQVPELAGDIEQALAGMDALGALLASIDWDTSNLATNPDKIAEFAQIATDGNFLAMSGALANIGVWFQSACS